MMTFAILLVAEVILGLMVGFILSDNKKGLSIEEIKLTSILFLITTAIVFWQNPELSGVVFVQLAVSWFILAMSVILGEMLKMRLICKIIRAIHKKDIQLAINELVQLAGATQYEPAGSDPKSLYHKLYDVQGMLQALAKKSKGVQSEAFLQKLYYLFELCEDYVSLTVKLKGDKSTPPDARTTWMSIGKELTNLSWDTLNHAEENVKNHLGRAFSIKVVQKALSKK